VKKYDNICEQADVFCVIGESSKSAEKTKSAKIQSVGG